VQVTTSGQAGVVVVAAGSAVVYNIL